MQRMVNEPVSYPWDGNVCPQEQNRWYAYAQGDRRRVVENIRKNSFKESEGATYDTQPQPDPQKQAQSMRSRSQSPRPLLIPPNPNHRRSISTTPLPIGQYCLSTLRSIQTTPTATLC
jgi:hypothetical protein